MNLNLSGTLNIFRLITRPSLCLPHHTVSTFNDLPVPLDKAFEGQDRKADIRAVVLDKDDCFAVPHSNEVYQPYEKRFEELKAAYPGRRLLIVSNTAGATTHDKRLVLSRELEKATGLTVLPHSSKKPGCGSEIMDYFSKYPETGVSHPSQVAVIGDRLSTDIMMANMMGAWGFWIRDGVVPANEKSIFSKMEKHLASFLQGRGVRAQDPTSPFE